MLVSQVIEQYKGTLSPETPASYLNILTKFAKYCRIEGEEELGELGPGSIHYFVRHNVGRLPYQPYPTRLMLEYTQVLKEFLMWCAKQGFVSEQLPNDLEMPEIDDVDVVEILTPDQIRRLLAACKRGRTNRQIARDRAILLVLLETGISARELCDLTIANVALTSDKSQITVIGKGGHTDRQIDLGDKTSAALGEYIIGYRRKAPQEEQHVFLSLEFHPLTVEELIEILHHLRDESGIQGVQCNPETFTQTFAVQYMKRWGNIIRLSYLLGHTTLRKTENYLQAYPEWVDGKKSPS